MRIGDILLGFVAPVLEIWLAGILIRRKLYREFPFFFAYIVSSILIALCRSLAAQNYHVYFVVYWASAAAYALLALLVLHEVFRWAFLEFYEHWRWFWLVFPGVSAIILLLSLVYAVEYPPVQASRLISLILVLGFAVNFIQAALFGLFFLLVWILGVRWRNYPFAIVMGFAISALGALGAYWLRSVYGTKLNTFVHYAVPVSYIFAVILWLDVFRRPEPEMKWTLPAGLDDPLKEVTSYGELLRKMRERLK